MGSQLQSWAVGQAFRSQSQHFLAFSLLPNDANDLDQQEVTQKHNTGHDCPPQ